MSLSIWWRYERALERLQELLGENKRLNDVLDREVGFEAQNATELSAAAVPRSIFSRSQNARGGGAEFGTMNDAKQRALEHKLDALAETSEKGSQVCTSEDRSEFFVNYGYLLVGRYPIFRVSDRFLYFPLSIY